MGTIAARKAATIMGHLRRVLAMELMGACQGIDMRGDKGMGIGTKPAYDVIRAVCPTLDEDRPLYEDINACEEVIKNGKLVEAVEKAAGVIEF